MEGADKVRMFNTLVEANTYGLVSADGLAVFGSQAIVSEGGFSDKLMNGAYVEFAHQIVHNMIDNDAPDNQLKRLDRMLPQWLPLDGLAGGAAAYYLNGTTGVLAFSAVHGLLHPMIVRKN